jgi:hypothetical protein
MTPPLPRPRPRQMGDERLIAALAATGCPVCTEVERAGRDYLESVLYEQANDVAFRRRLLAGGGFCAQHTRLTESVDRLKSGGALGAAILLQAVLRPRLAALSSVRGDRSSAKQLGEATRDAWDCVCCEHETRVTTDVLDRALQNAAADPVWADWLTGADLCLSHLAAVVERSRAQAAELTAPLLQAQVARLRDVDERLAAFQHHHAHDRRALLTDDERRSVSEVRVTLAGGDGR